MDLTEEERLKNVQALLAKQDNQLPSNTFDSNVNEVDDQREVEEDEELRLKKVRELLQRQSISSGSTPKSNSARISSRKQASASPPKRHGVSRSPPIQSERRIQTPKSGSSSDVFDRLYKQRKVPTPPKTDPEAFHPKILSKSREIAGDRGSLYARAVLQQQRKEALREAYASQEREARNRSRLSVTSQELAWNKLRREVEQLFTERIPNTEREDGATIAVDLHAFNELSSELNLDKVSIDLFEMLHEDDSRLLRLDTFSEYLRQIVFPDPNSPDTQLVDEFSNKVRILLVGRKATPSTTSLERVKQELAAETPFTPKVTERSRILDEQRYKRLGIDPSLSRADKIHAELEILGDRKEQSKMKYAKKELVECTFKPRTTRYSPQGSVTTLSTTNDISDVGNRLYRESIERRNRRELKANEIAARELEEINAECTFKPNINANRRSSNLPDDDKTESSVRVKSFDSAVNRLHSWRQKHVTVEDTKDIKYIQRNREQNPSPSTAKRTPLRRPPPSNPSISRQQPTRNIPSTRGRDVPPPPPPPPIIEEEKDIIFSADVTLMDGSTATVTLKEGEDVRLVASSFARNHHLDKESETALLSTILQALESIVADGDYLLDENPIQEDSVLREGEESFQYEEEADEQLLQDDEEDDAILVDVVVRPGEAYTLRIEEDDDPIAIAYEFAEEVGMEDHARDRLIESLQGLRV